MEYKGKNVWQEDAGAADAYRRQYVAGIKDYIKNRNLECKNKRKVFLNPEELVKNPEKFRDMYKEMLGINQFLENGMTSAEMIYVGKDDICRIYRLTVKVTDEIPFYAMLLIPHGIDKCPLAIVQHGGWGTPELCCDMNGKNNYNHMAQRVLERNIAVLAPQLMLWTTEEKETARAHPIEFSRNDIDKSLKRFGTTITALEIAGIIKCVDYVCGLPEIEDDNIAMIGLSYGGYFTLHTMAIDTRIRAGYTAGCFNDRDVYDWYDWCYFGSALRFQDAEVAALCAPRKLYIQIGKTDEVFDYHSSIPEIERVREYYQAYGNEENFRYSIWEGGHTISHDKEGYDFIFPV